MGQTPHSRQGGSESPDSSDEGTCSPSWFGGFRRTHLVGTRGSNWMDQIRCWGTFKRLSPESWSGKKCLQRYSCLATIYVHSHTHKLTRMHTHTLPDTKAVGPQSLLGLVPRHVYHGRAESMELTVPESPFP